MKKIIYLLIMMLTAGLLLSCTAEPVEPPAEVDDSAVYGEGLITQIISDTPDDVAVYSIANKIRLLQGTKPEIKGDSTAAIKHEIVIGNMNRPIAQKAMALLNEKINNHVPSDELVYDTVFYGIYAEGGSVAVVWSCDEARDTVLTYFLDTYVVKNNMKFTDGFTEMIDYSEIEEMRAEEAKAADEAYEKIRAQYGDGVVEALKAHLATYDRSFYIWLANLYDPGEYDADGNPIGGGFYYSNSARDNAGYYIDLESTGQALSFLASSGMVKNFKNEIPEKMQKEVVAFALACQSEVDGYFYHPQWGTGITPARRSRDLGWAVNNIIVRFGYQPYWDTPNGDKGIYGAPSVNKTASELTSPLGGSAAAAVSKVVETASYIDKYQSFLRSLDAWQSYLDGLVPDLKTSSYSIGHNLAEQSRQIAMRDTEAAAHGEPTGYVEAVTRFFNDNQNPENGLWEDEVSYNSINGLMKIMALYNNLNIELNYAEKAVDSAAAIAKLNTADVNGKEATNSVDVYNPWCAIERVFTNVKKFGSADRAAAMQAQLCENAEEMIRVSTAKAKKFRKDDGSFGYTWNYSPANSQNAPVAVPGTVEGDVNGGTIALVGITGNMLNALGITGLSIYHSSDLKIFLHEIEGLEHVVKEEPTYNVERVTFEDATVGDNNPGGISHNLTEGSVEVVEDGRGGKAVMLTTVPDKGDAINATPGCKTDGMSSYILEFDIKFSEIKANAGTAMQISMGGLYMFTVGITTSGSLTFGDSSATNNSAITSKYAGSYDAFAWHTVRLVHYREGNTPLITELYVDGALVGTSDNYLGKESGNASKGYTTARFYCLFSTNHTVLLDNILCDSSNDAYTAEKPETPEEVDRAGHYGFSSSLVGDTAISGVKINQNPEAGNSVAIAADPTNAENKTLEVVTQSSSSAGNHIYFDSDGKSGSKAVFETRINITELNRAADILQIFLQGAKGTFFSVNIQLNRTSGGVMPRVYEKNADNSRNTTIVEATEELVGWFTLRIEYDYTARLATVTLNDTYTGTTDAYYKDGIGGPMTKADFYTTFACDLCLYLDDVTVENK